MRVLRCLRRHLNASKPDFKCTRRNPKPSGLRSTENANLLQISLPAQVCLFGSKRVNAFCRKLSSACYKIFCHFYFLLSNHIRSTLISSSLNKIIIEIAWLQEFSVKENHLIARNVVISAFCQSKNSTLQSLLQITQTFPFLKLKIGGFGNKFVACKRNNARKFGMTKYLFHHTRLNHLPAPLNECQVAHAFNLLYFMFSRDYRSEWRCLSNNSTLEIIFKNSGRSKKQKRFANRWSILPPVARKCWSDPDENVVQSTKAQFGPPLWSF